MPDQINVAFDEPPFFFDTVISNEPRRDKPWSLITISKRFFGNCALMSLKIWLAVRLYVWQDLHTSNKRYASIGPAFLAGVVLAAFALVSVAAAFT